MEGGLLKRLMAKRCDACPICRHARNHPESLVGRLVSWHGRFCPFWRAWQEVYGDQAAATDAEGHVGAAPHG